MSLNNSILPTKINRFGRRDSLIKQASLDREQNEGIRRQNTLRSRKELERSLTICKTLLKCLNDESVELIKNASEEEQLNLLLILNCLGENNREILQSALQQFLSIGLYLNNLEIIPELEYSKDLEMRAKLSGKKWMFLEVLSKIVVENSIERIELKNLFSYKENNDF